ncbi:MAG: hypothetical protein KGH57_02400 [Candidatus Micrarchaeota archaeon]|nr:hypothetical protein [Candidatus Micrarchaeota archaeon]
MCGSCTVYDDEAEGYVSVTCACPCAEQDLSPSEFLGGSTCDECNHVVKG